MNEFAFTNDTGTPTPLGQASPMINQIPLNEPDFPPPYQQETQPETPRKGRLPLIAAEGGTWFLKLILDRGLERDHWLILDCRQSAVRCSYGKHRPRSDDRDNFRSETAIGMWIAF